MREALDLRKAWVFAGYVQLQVPLVSGGVGAVRARERSLLGVAQHVTIQVVAALVSTEALPTLVALQAGNGLGLR